MPKWPVRAENSVPEAQTLCVERFLRDLFNAPATGVCVLGGGTKIGPDFVLCVFLRKWPVRAEVFDPDAHILCVQRSRRDVFDIPGHVGWGATPKKSMLEQPETDRKHPEMCVWFYVF